jgi:hypothetical protein
MGDTDAQRQLWRRLALLGSRRQHRGVSGDCRRRSRPAVFLQPAARARRLRPSAVPIGSRSAALRWPATAGQEERERHRSVLLQRGVAPYRGPSSTGAGPRVQFGPIQGARRSVSGTGMCSSSVEWPHTGGQTAPELALVCALAPYRGPSSTGAGPRVQFGPIQGARRSVSCTGMCSSSVEWPHTGGQTAPELALACSLAPYRGPAGASPGSRHL